MKHTKGPWYTISTVAGDVWIYASGNPVLEPEHMPSTLRMIGRKIKGFFRVRATRYATTSDADWWDELEANARRIVASVNACDGLDDPAVEIAKLKSDKANLLEALNRLLGPGGDLHNSDAQELGLAAISKATP